MPDDVRLLSGIDPFLNEGADGECDCCEEEASAYFTKLGEVDNLFDSGIDSVGEERYEEEDEEGVGGLDL